MTKEKDLSVTYPFRSTTRERDLKYQEFQEIRKKHEAAGDFYNSTTLRETKANYQICLGQRSDGKSYDTKMIDALEAFFCFRFHFGYIRFTEDECTATLAQDYWGDCDEILQDAAAIAYPGWDDYRIIARRGEFTLQGERFDPHERANLDTLGYYFAVVRQKKYKSSSFPHIKNITFEEVLSKDAGRPTDFSDFVNLISTIRRHRTDITVRMLGNTINRHSELLTDMNINLTELRQGEITLYRFLDEATGGANTVAVEWQRPHEQSAESAAFAAFGSRKKELHINSGQWEVKDYPLFTESILGKCNRGALIAEFDFMRIFIYQADGKLYATRNRIPSKVTTYITVTTAQSDYSRRILNIRSDPGMKIRAWLERAFYAGQVRFDNNLTGDDFEHFLFQL